MGGTQPRDAIYNFSSPTLGLSHQQLPSFHNNTAKMPTEARDIANRPLMTTSNALSVSTSPTAAFHSPLSSLGASKLGRGASQPKQLKPFDTQDIKILLLENVNESGKEILRGQGYQVEALKSSLPEDELIEKIRFGEPLHDPAILFSPPPIGNIY